MNGFDQDRAAGSIISILVTPARTFVLHVDCQSCKAGQGTRIISQVLGMPKQCPGIQGDPAGRETSSPQPEIVSIVGAAGDIPDIHLVGKKALNANYPDDSASNMC